MPPNENGVLSLLTFIPTLQHHASKTATFKVFWPQLSSQNDVGLNVYHAARIMSLGHSVQVLLLQTIGGLVKHVSPERINWQDLGEHRLKDL